jgi:hypothetical protein
VYTIGYTRDMNNWKLTVFLRDDTKFEEELMSYPAAITYLERNKYDAHQVKAIKLVEIDSPDRESLGTPPLNNDLWFGVKNSADKGFNYGTATSLQGNSRSK